jgi:hypothetical protein
VRNTAAEVQGVNAIDRHFAPAVDSGRAFALPTDAAQTRQLITDK